MSTGRPLVRAGTLCNKLIAAAKQGDIDELQRLLLLRDNAAQLRNSHFNTPLRAAVASGQLAAAKLLVQHGADPRQVNHGGSSLLEAASLSGHRHMVAWLCDLGLQAGILELSAVGELERVEREIRADRDCVHTRDRRQFTPLHCAAQNGHVEVIELLIKTGANVDAENKHRHQPLSIAVECNRTAAVNCLLEKGADPNARGGHYRGRVLHRAVLNRNTTIVHALLQAGANPNLLDAGGKSPLHDAIGLGSSKLVSMLLAHPFIDATIRSGPTKFSNQGETPLEYASNRGKSHIARLLDAHLAIST